MSNNRFDKKRESGLPGISEESGKKTESGMPAEAYQEDWVSTGTGLSNPAGRRPLIFYPIGQGSIERGLLHWK
jgi:hypothetical protein